MVWGPLIILLHLQLYLSCNGSVHDAFSLSVIHIMILLIQKKTAMILDFILRYVRLCFKPQSL